MAAFNKYNDFTRAVLAGTHQFGTHVFKAAFTNTAPNVALPPMPHGDSSRA